MNYQSKEMRNKPTHRKTDRELLESLNYPGCLLLFKHTNDPEEIGRAINFLKDFVQKYAENNISTSQVRNLYAKARSASNETKLQLLRPQIAYLLARQKNPKDDKVRTFFLLLDDLISKGISLTDFQKVFEVIVAYHKYFDKKN